MIRLRQTKGADTGRELDFVLSRVRIGRVPDSEVNFDPEEDLDASGRHAEIRRERGGYWIVDTDSRNGTWVNGERVKRTRLRAGDELEFGRGGPRLLVVELAERSVVPRTHTEPFYSVEPPSTEDPFSVPVTVTTKLSHIRAALAPLPAQTPSSGLECTMSSQVSFAGPDEDTLPPPPPDPVIMKRKRPLGMRAAAGAGLLVLAAAALFLFTGSDAAKPEQAPTLSEPKLAEKLQPAVRQVVGLDADGASTTLCLAFAVMERLYATTASCIALVQRGQERGLRYVVQGGAGEPADVKRMWRHPDYHPSLRSPNVGLLEVTGTKDVPVNLAAATLSGPPKPGDSVSLFDGIEPSVSAKILSVAPLEGDPTGGAGLLFHGAVASDGSPIVDANGLVVGIHVAAHGSLDGYGVRADRIEGLVRGLQLTAQQGQLSP